ncbi:hypothetical protein [Thermoflavimicrobium dichotomicum]|uniref:YtkA-like n=1 Tax=Thermoflavimicrobium dichotomicum TaxID=46223 RepID=A0A1I3PJX0_9BACL|nr:hypothetical protein [Thermoflavimicrobium dichotomicum]SFJ21792.1 hypothetical protein SAMN05421852_1062 [Thermoflavimicrobium dichotomicum]
MRIQWRVWLGVLCLCLSVSIPVWAHGGHEHEGSHQESHPVPLDQAIPDGNLAQVEVPVQASEGSLVRVQLSSPPKQFFPTTDFPIVEGTQLLDGTFAVHDGKVRFQYMFPIRGTYQLSVEGVEGSTLKKQVIPIAIDENPDEVRNLILFISGLVLLGLACGFLLTTWRGRADETI